VTCAETQFIVAEAEARAGNPLAARTAANAAIACEEALHGLDLQEIPVLVGNALLEAILREKYIALFLNYEVWNDYKRTCFPEVQTSDGDAIPGRLLYGATERATNPRTDDNPRGIPDVGEQRQTPRNANDPQPCT
jgi:hypothetical protein